MDGLHTVEASWRQCRAGQPSGEMLRTCLKHLESYSKFIGLTNLPGEVALPMGIPATLFKNGAISIAPDLLKDNVARSAMINTLHVWAAYREAKTIYEVEESCFQQAIEIARRQSAKSLELRATISLARLLVSQGRRDEARPILAAIYGWFTEGFDTADLKDAKALIDELNA
jgi:hypothetical protein